MMWAILAVTTVHSIVYIDSGLSLFSNKAHAGALMRAVMSFTEEKGE